MTKISTSQIIFWKRIIFHNQFLTRIFVLYYKSFFVLLFFSLEPFHASFAVLLTSSKYAFKIIQWIERVYSCYCLFAEICVEHFAFFAITWIKLEQTVKQHCFHALANIGLGGWRVCRYFSYHIFIATFLLV